MSERDKVQPQGLCPWKLCAKAHASHAKGAHPQGVSPTSLDAKALSRLRQNGETEIVRSVQRGCEALYCIFRATQQFARVAAYSAFP